MVARNEVPGRGPRESFTKTAFKTFLLAAVGALGFAAATNTVQAMSTSARTGTSRLSPFNLFRVRAGAAKSANINDVRHAGASKTLTEENAKKMGNEKQVVDDVMRKQMTEQGLKKLGPDDAAQAKLAGESKQGQSKLNFNIFNR